MTDQSKPLPEHEEVMRGFRHQWSAAYQGEARCGGCGIRAQLGPDGNTEGLCPVLIYDLAAYADKLAADRNRFESLLEEQIGVALTMSEERARLAAELAEERKRG